MFNDTPVITSDLNALLKDSEAATPTTSAYGVRQLVYAQESGNIAVAFFYKGWLALYGDGVSVPLSRESAKLYFKRSIEESSDANAAALYQLGNLYVDDGRYKEAELLFDRAVEGGKDLSSMLALAHCLCRPEFCIAVDKKRAKTLYEGVLNTAPEESLARTKAMWGLACFLEDDGEHKSAILLYLKLADERGYRAAMVHLGDIWLWDDFDRAYELYLRASKGSSEDEEERKDQADALFKLGEIHQRGQGPNGRDEFQAFRFFEKAAELGHTEAMARLGMIYQLGVRNGDGEEVVANDDEQAKKMYLRAIDEGNDKSAMRCLAHMLRIEDTLGASKLFQRLIDEDDDSDAMTSLGLLYERGHEGFPQDAEKAVELYERAIERNNTEAMWNLGDLYADGVGTVPANLTRAVELFKTAAALGEGRSMIAGGCLLATGGPGVAPDISAAEAFFRQYLDEFDYAADCSQARVELARLLYRSEPPSIDRRKEAINLLLTEISTEYNGEHQSLAYLKLAAIFENGDNVVSRDVPRAVSYFRKAIDSEGYGEMLACWKLVLLLEREGIDAAEDRRRIESLSQGSILSLASALERADDFLEVDISMAAYLRAHAERCRNV